MSDSMYIAIKNASTKVDHKGESAKVGVRVYNSSPGLVTMQIRSHGPVAQSGRGVSRPAYSMVQMTVGEIEELISDLQMAMDDAGIRVRS